MKLIFFFLAALLSGGATAQQWNLADTAYDAAVEAREIYVEGGNEAMVRAIKVCHAQITVKTAFNMATARCLTMDFAGTLMAGRMAEETGVNDIPSYYTEGGAYIGRNTPYLMFVPQEQLDPIMLTIKQNIIDAIPAVESLLIPTVD
ncbi:MAG TPA: hypothetical protein VLF09_01225 [Cellvibrio sp.]|nr:hypothetical protein [Cellvibrio sp.]